MNTSVAVAVGGVEVAARTLDDGGREVEWTGAGRDSIELVLQGRLPEIVTGVRRPTRPYHREYPTVGVEVDDLVGPFIHDVQGPVARDRKSMRSRAQDVLTPGRHELTVPIVNDHPRKTTGQQIDAIGAVDRDVAYLAVGIRFGQGAPKFSNLERSHAVVRFDHRGAPPFANSCVKLLAESTDPSLTRTPRVKLAYHRFCRNPG